MRKSPTRKRSELSKRPSNLKRIRTENGIERSVLARTAGVADRTIERIENGEETTHRTATLYKILNALNRLRDKNLGSNPYEFKEVFPNHNEE